MTLTAVRVEEVLRDCLVPDPDVPHVPVEGIVNTYGLDPEKLAQHTDEIVAMLAELPDTFRVDTVSGGGGGWSFLNACMDRHGNQWTGMQIIMEQLFVLGMAIDKVQLLMPREMWSALPGGMPYYGVK